MKPLPLRSRKLSRPLSLLLGLGLAACLASTLAGCKKRPDENATGPIVVGAYLSMTGSMATFGVLCVLALGAPITSHPPADAGTVPAVLALDWILLFLHPLTYATSAGAVWWAVSASLLLLLALPFLPQPARAPVAVVDAANCNGCRRCFADCP